MIPEGENPEHVQANIAEAKANPSATGTSDWYARNLKHLDGTDVDFVPAVFDVEGKGNCFFLAVTYVAQPPPSSTSPFGPDVSLAMRYRNASTDDIKSHMQSQYYDEYMSWSDLLESGIEDVDFRNKVVSKKNDLIVGICCELDIRYVPIIDRAGFEAFKRKVDREINKLRLPTTWVTSHMATVVAKLSNFNIVHVIVPNSWTRHVPSYVDIRWNATCSMNDMHRGGEIERSEPVHDRTIFVLHNGTHYMPIVFLNTDPNASPDNRVIQSVPSWDRAKWAMRVAKYWGFPARGMRSIKHWIIRRNCGYEGWCSLVLGHSGDHKSN